MLAWEPQSDVRLKLTENERLASSIVRLEHVVHPLLTFKQSLRVQCLAFGYHRLSVASRERHCIRNLQASEVSRVMSVKMAPASDVENVRHWEDAVFHHATDDAALVVILRVIDRAERQVKIAESFDRDVGLLDDVGQCFFDPFLCFLALEIATAGGEASWCGQTEHAGRVVGERGLLQSVDCEVESPGN